MLLAIDVHYKENYAKSVGVLSEWQDAAPKQMYLDVIKEVAPYKPGEFYKRELPCILSLLQQVNLDAVKAIIVDGHVYVDNDKSYGLGGYLHEALEGKIPVIGVAKSAFITANKVSIPVYRGTSKKPLWVSAIDYDVELAATQVKAMHGAYRLPTLLKEMDRLTKED